LENIYIERYPHRPQHVEKMDNIQFTALNNVRLSLNRFAWNAPFPTTTCKEFLYHTSWKFDKAFSDSSQTAQRRTEWSPHNMSLCYINNDSN